MAHISEFTIYFSSAACTFYNCISISACLSVCLPVCHLECFRLQQSKMKRKTTECGEM